MPEAEQQAHPADLHIWQTGNNNDYETLSCTMQCSVNTRSLQYCKKESEIPYTYILIQIVILLLKKIEHLSLTVAQLVSVKFPFISRKPLSSKIS